MTETKKKRGEDLPFGQESFARMMRDRYQFSHRMGVELFQQIGVAIVKTLEAGESARCFDQLVLKIVDGTRGKKVRVRLAAGSHLDPLVAATKNEPAPRGRKRPDWTPPPKSGETPPEPASDPG